MGQVTAAGIYARISSDQEGTGAGVERQVSDCRRLAADLGWPVADEYVDNDVSAYSGRLRPQYRRLLADVAAGTIDAILVYHLDRLTRRPKELEEFLEVLDAARVTNVRFVAGDMDLGTGDGLLIARIQAAVAANESASKSRRVKRKLDEIAEQGRPHGGSVRPFGYENDRVTVRPAEATIVKQAAARFLAGETFRSIAAWLNGQSILTSTGGPWDSQAVRNVLTSPRYAGLRSHRKQVIGPAVWKPILTEDQHRRILLRVDDLKVSGRRPARRYLLSGMLRCGHCGTRLYSAARKDRRRYVCLSGPDHGGCGGITVIAPPVEALIADAVLYRLDTPALAEALAASPASTDFGALSERLVADKEQREELAHLYAARQITVAEWMTARTPIEDRIAAAERRIAQATNHTDLAAVIGRGSALRTQWATLNLDRQAAVIGSILDHAVVGPGTPGARAFNPARITPVWRL